MTAVRTKKRIAKTPSFGDFGKSPVHSRTAYRQALERLRAADPASALSRLRLLSHDTLGIKKEVDALDKFRSASYDAVTALLKELGRELDRHEKLVRRYER